MSTRATIILTYMTGETVQMYHHCDGYPKYMGRLLNSFCSTAFFMKYNMKVDEAMRLLLSTEGQFEFESNGDIHTDVEYVWYVNLTEDGYSISYTEMRAKKMALDYKDWKELQNKRDEIFEEVLNARTGEIMYTDEV